MNNRFIALLTVVFMTLSNISSYAQRPNATYQAYIAQYATTAQVQMQRYGIPASITLAQALLESAAGQSVLARKANNHFGIKVTSDWKGPYIVQDDDHRNERFRAYGSAAESYEDHSKFLKRSRYQSLSLLPKDDYKGWAKGLKACGYATSPTYATRLIEIIELYELQKYDHPGRRYDVEESTIPAVANKRNQTQHGTTTTQTTTTYYGHRNNIYDLVRFCNGSRYVIAQPGDTWQSLALVYGLKERKLRAINEYPAGYQPTTGTPIYLDTKRSRASKTLKGKSHIVRAGESMHSISQIYGIRMKTLYNVNHLPLDYQPRPGDSLRLR